MKTIKSILSALACAIYILLLRTIKPVSDFAMQNGSYFLAGIYLVVVLAIPLAVIFRKTIYK